MLSDRSVVDSLVTRARGFVSLLALVARIPLTVIVRSFLRSSPGRAMLSGSLLLVVTGFATTQGPLRASIDTRAALVINGQQVSQYLVDKYYHRYVDGFEQQHHRPASASERAAWLDLFIAQQVIIHQAMADGLGARPEVQKIVNRMERHMLAKPEGPFYEILYNEKPALDPGIEELYSRIFRSLEVHIIHFPDDASASSALGPDFEQVSLEEQARRANACKDADDAEIRQGTMAWPFFPFVEIADTIFTAPLKRWSCHRDPISGTYAIFIATEKVTPSRTLTDGDRENFEKFAGAARRQALQRRRRFALLTESRFALNVPVARALADFCGQLDPQCVEVPLLPPTLAASILFEYHDAGRAVHVEVQDYRDQFNNRLIREIPRTLATMRDSAGDMLVEELDVRAARARGVDATDQFIEDRKGFEGYQVLDLFEKESLVPNVKIDPVEITRYYAEHAADYRRVAKIRGRLLQFSSLERATAWLRRSTDHQVSPDHTEELEITRNHPIAGFEALQSLLFQPTRGAVFGPVERDSIAAVLVREEDLATELPPMDEVAASIRAALIREALPAQERELARELTGRFTVENHIDYVGYGLPPVGSLSAK